MPRCKRYEFKETLCLIAKNEKRRPYATMTDEQKELSKIGTLHLLELTRRKTTSFWALNNKRKIGFCSFHTHQLKSKDT